MAKKTLNTWHVFHAGCVCSLCFPAGGTVGSKIPFPLVIQTRLILLPTGRIIAHVFITVYKSHFNIFTLKKCIPFWLWLLGVHVCQGFSFHLNVQILYSLAFVSAHTPTMSLWQAGCKNVVDFSASWEYDDLTYWQVGITTRWHMTSCHSPVCEIWGNIHAIDNSVIWGSYSLHDWGGSERVLTAVRRVFTMRWLARCGWWRCTREWCIVHLPTIWRHHVSSLSMCLCVHNKSCFHNVSWLNHWMLTKLVKINYHDK